MWIYPTMPIVNNVSLLFWPLACIYFELWLDLTTYYTSKTNIGMAFVSQFKSELANYVWNKDNNNNTANKITRPRPLSPCACWLTHKLLQSWEALFYAEIMWHGWRRRWWNSHSLLLPSLSLKILVIKKKMFRLDLQRLYNINRFKVPSQGFRMVQQWLSLPPTVAACSQSTYGKQAVKHTVNEGGRFLKNLWCCVGRRV